MEGLSYFMDGTNRKCLPDGRKEMQRPGKFENVKKKDHATARKLLQHGISDFVSASGSGRGEVRGSRKNFSGEEEQKDK